MMNTRIQKTIKWNIIAIKDKKLLMRLYFFMAQTQIHIWKLHQLFTFIYISAKAQEMKAMAEQGLNAAKDKCKVQ